MADPTGKVKPGDGLNRLFQAATFNLTMDTVNDYLRRARGRTGAAGNAPDPIVPATLIYVKNTTGSTLLPYSVVTPSGTPIYDPADEPVGQQQQPLIEVIAPASASDVVLITQEEIADGEIGLAASAGVCVAAVAVSSGTHKFAAPSAGVTTSLTSGTSGSVRILEPWSSGTGERLVLIGSQAASIATSFSGARVTKIGNQSFTSGTFANVTFEHDEFDTDSYHDTVTNNDRLTVPSTGYYLVGGTVRWDTPSGGVRSLRVHHSVAGSIGGSKVEITTATPENLVTCSAIQAASAGEYFFLDAVQTSGSSMTILQASNTTFWIAKLG